MLTVCSGIHIFGQFPICISLILPDRGERIGASKTKQREVARLYGKVCQIVHKLKFKAEHKYNLKKYTLDKYILGLNREGDNSGQEHITRKAISLLQKDHKVNPLIGNAPVWEHIGRV